MKQAFISLTGKIRTVISKVVNQQETHGRWLNTLSYLENCGARKIASCEHPTLVKEEMLKHAAEEFRHAFYLKKQLLKVGQGFEDYSLPYLLGGWSACHYLNRLDVETCRHLNTLNVHTGQLAYLLVTYAIELRASELYPIYQNELKKQGSKVQVQSILLEEKEHLQEMENALKHVPHATDHVQAVCKIEAKLCEHWLNECLTHNP